MKNIHLAWAVAAAILMVVGLAVGRGVPRDVAPEDSRPQFALMLYEDSSYQAATHAEDRVAEYSAWARSLAQRGLLVDGAELSNTGVLLNGTHSAPDAVPVSAQGMLAGYFIIRAADRAEAERIARECPHLKYRGTISLRPIVTPANQAMASPPRGAHSPVHV